ncbi:MAG TPA: hypothetical protein VFH08_03690 [Chitinophagaceae bacterium]|nr:hypothetical protein [Chitinophagaceae bacterium]
MGKDRKKNPPPDNSIFDEREPEQEPSTSPGSGQHQPDIQDERSKKKRSNIPQPKDDINPEDVPGNGNPEEYNDGEPVEEKSPRARL